MRGLFINLCFLAVVITASGWLIGNRNDVKLTDKHIDSDKIGLYQLHNGDRKKRSESEESLKTTSEETPEENDAEKTETTTNDANDGSSEEQSGGSTEASKTKKKRSTVEGDSMKTQKTGQAISKRRREVADGDNDSTTPQEGTDVTEGEKKDFEQENHEEVSKTDGTATSVEPEKETTASKE